MRLYDAKRKGGHSQLKSFSFFIFILFHLMLVHAETSEDKEQDDEKPYVYVFCGIPGDEEHDELYNQRLDRLKRIFNQRYRLRDEHLKILYGHDGMKYNGPCTKNTVDQAFQDIKALARQDKKVLLFFLGHSNPTPKGSHFNIADSDITAMEMGEIFKDLQQPIAFIFTTSSSGSFIRYLSKKGRVIITASNLKDKDNETLFPDAMLDALEHPELDINQDNHLSLDEFFIGCTSMVDISYLKINKLRHAHALLDGNGDGLGTERPARKDKKGASLFKFKIYKMKKNKKQFL